MSPLGFLRRPGQSQVMGMGLGDSVSRCAVAGVLEPSYFHMLLQILGTLKALVAVLAFVRS
jgi:hypothetical protein